MAGFFAKLLRFCADLAGFCAELLRFLLKSGADFAQIWRHFAQNRWDFCLNLGPGNTSGLLDEISGPVGSLVPRFGEPFGSLAAGSQLSSRSFRSHATNTIRLNQTILLDAMFTCSGIPLTLGYCTTIAKVQGRTLDIIAIDPDLNAQSVGYTAITRVRDLSNLFWLKKPTAGFLAPPAFSKKK